MNRLKTTLASILVLFALLLSIGLFLPDEYGVERSMVIHAPTDKVFEQVNSVDNWMIWFPRPQFTSEVVVQYSTPNSRGEGAWFSFRGEQNGTGAGRLTIIESTPNQHIQLKLALSPNPINVGDISCVFEPVDGNTKVTWQVKGIASSYFERYFKFLMENMVGDLFEQGLASLKSVCEA